MSRNSERSAGCWPRVVYLAVPLCTLGVACDTGGDVPPLPADCNPAVECPDDPDAAPVELRLGSWSGDPSDEFDAYVDGEEIQLKRFDSGIHLELRYDLPRFMNGTWRFESSFVDSNQVLIAHVSVEGLACACIYQCPCFPLRPHHVAEFPENAAPISGFLSGSATFVETGETYSAGPIAVTILPP